MGTGGAVSAQVRRLPFLLSKDRRLRRLVQKAEAALGREKLKEHSVGKWQTHRR